MSDRSRRSQGSEADSQCSHACTHTLTHTRMHTHSARTHTQRAHTRTNAHTHTHTRTHTQRSGVQEQKADVGHLDGKSQFFFPFPDRIRLSDLDPWTEGGAGSP